MATVILGAIGAGIGAAFGDAKTGFSVGVLLAGALFPPKGARQERGRLDDLKVTGSAYGAMIPQVYGCYRLGGNIIWATDLVEHSTVKKEGGKGGPKTTVKQYTYSVSMLVLLCEGEVGVVERVWLEDKLIYDPSGKSGTIIPQPDYLEIFLGTETQMPWSVMEADPLIGVGNAPAHRGHCLLGFEDLDLSPYGNRIPMVTAEVCPKEGLPEEDMLWNFDASLQEGYSDGQSMTAGMTDFSPNGYDAIDSASCPPGTFQSGPADLINGLPHFEIAANQGFDIPFGTIPASVAPDGLSFYWVGDYTVPQAGSALLLQVYEDPELTIGFDIAANSYGPGDPPGNAIAIETTDNTGFNRKHTTAPAASGLQVVAIVIDPDLQTITVYRNGSVVLNDVTDAHYLPHDLGDDTIELFHFAGTNSLVGKHCQFIAYAINHSTATVQQISDLLMSKWGV